MESASADWTKLDMLWIGPLTDVPYLPLSVDAVFDVLGWSVLLNFFFLRVSGSKSAVQVSNLQHKIHTKKPTDTVLDESM